MQLRGNWNYPTTIRFGAGRIAELPEAVRVAGITRPLLVTDPYLAGLPMLADAKASLDAAGLPCAVFSAIKPNPVAANVEAGLYPLPADHDGALPTLLYRSRLFFDDLPEIHRRRESNAHDEVRNDDIRGKRPDYYLQNFHFQSGGWLTDESAARYDTQVEVLFKGTANAMRRMALPELHEVFRGRDQRGLRLADIGCGTGRFLDFVKQAWPRLPVTGIDGTMRRVRNGASGRAHLKTGSLRDVNGVAGYVLGDSGRRYVLVAIVNHPNASAARPALEALVQWASADAAPAAR